MTNNGTPQHSRDGSGEDASFWSCCNVDTTVVPHHQVDPIGGNEDARHVQTSGTSLSAKVNDAHLPKEPSSTSVNCTRLVEMLLQSCEIVRQGRTHSVLHHTLAALKEYVELYEKQNQSTETMATSLAAHDAKSSDLRQPNTSSSSPHLAETTKKGSQSNTENSLNIRGCNPFASTPAKSPNPTAPTATAKTTYKPITIDPNLPADVRLEKEKKIMAERRRKDLELQRKLARAQQNQQSKTSKIKELQTDKRKQELLLRSQPQKSTSINEFVRQIDTQIIKLLEEVKKSEQGIKDIESEINRRKEEAKLPLFVYAKTASSTESAPKKTESKLELQKRMATEKRRRQLEEERQRAREDIQKEKERKHRLWLEEERRKEELVERAKAQRNGLDDLDLLKRLNVHMTEFEAENEMPAKVQTINATVPLQTSSPPTPLPSKCQSNSAQSPNDGRGNTTEYTSQRQPESPSLFASPLPTDRETKTNDSVKPPTPPPRHETSIHHEKYTKMVAATDADNQDGDASLHIALKRKVLVQWALQPPHMQVLRPIHELICSIHTVFPPANGLAEHGYFVGWGNVLPEDIRDSHSLMNKLDEKKLSKAIRKLRFFLHPDKLPKDLPATHRFLSQLLWDVTNDAYEDHKRANEELDWVNG